MIITCDTVKPLTIFEIDIRTEIHWPGHSLEDETPLSSRGKRELDLSVQSTRSE